MYLFTNLKSAFKRRPPEYIPGVGWQNNQGRIKPNKTAPPVVEDFGIPENKGEIEGHPFKFNVGVGYPKAVEMGGNRLAQGLAGRPLTFANHAKERALERGLDFDKDLGHLQNRFPKPEHGFKPVEIEVLKKPEGVRISKLLMRGPRPGMSDVVMPVITENPNHPFVSTVWPNDNNDKHSTLDLHRVHLPEEFAHGKAPTRRLYTDQERKMPGYKPLLDSPETRMAILKKHGIKPI